MKLRLISHSKLEKYNILYNAPFTYSDRVYYYGIYINDTLSGYFGVRRLNFYSAEICHLFISQSFRNQKIASNALEIFFKHLNDFLPSNFLPILFLASIAKTNIYSIKIFEKLGFEFQGELLSPYSENIVCIYKKNIS